MPFRYKHSRIYKPHVVLTSKEVAGVILQGMKADASLVNLIQKSADFIEIWWGDHVNCDKPNVFAKSLTIYRRTAAEGSGAFLRFLDGVDGETNFNLMYLKAQNCFELRGGNDPGQFMRFKLKTPVGADTGIQLPHGMKITCYSDNFSTVKLKLDGALGDIKCIDDSAGLILKDRTLGTYHRIVLDDGVLSVEAE